MAAVDRPITPRSARLVGPILVLSVIVGINLVLLERWASPSTELLTLGLTLAVATALAVVALYRFEWFLPAALVIRPGLDDLGGDRLGPLQPAAVLGLVVIGMVVLRLVVDKVNGFAFLRTPVAKAWALFVGAMILSLPLSLDVGRSFPAVLGLISALLVYLAIERQLVADPWGLERILAAMALGAIAPLATGLVQYRWTGTLEPISGLIRIDGSFVHYNPFGTYLALIITIGVAVLAASPRRGRFWLVAGLLVAGFVMVVTYARGAWFSLVFALLLMSLRIDKRLAGAVVVAVGLALVAVPDVWDRVVNVFATTSADGGAKTDDSLAWRISYWVEVLPLAERNPLTGVGLQVVPTLTLIGRQPHNSFVQALVEGGVFGFLGWLGLVGSIVWVAVRGWDLSAVRHRLGLTRLQQAMLVGSVAGVATVVPQLLTENVLTDTVLQWHYAIPAAYLAVVVYRREDLVSASALRGDRAPDAPELSTWATRSPTAPPRDPAEVNT